MITANELRALLNYDQNTGEFRWKVRNSNRASVGSVAGCCDANGYVKLRINNVLYLGHRLAWLYVTGQWPLQQIDHINGDRSDNRIANLREATPIQNAGNSRRRRRNTSGYKGVCWNKSRGKWAAQMGGPKHRNLGHFDTPEEAHAAYLAAARAYFGEFARAA